MKTAMKLGAALVVAGAARSACAQYTGPGLLLQSAFSHSSDINVAETFTVAWVRVTLEGVSHGRTGDVIFVLSHQIPNGGGNPGITLFSRPGVHPGNDFGSPATLNGEYSFSDEATMDFWDAAVGAGAGVVPNGEYHACAGWTGFVPLQYLSTFYGATAAGKWTLTGSDNAPGFEGSITGWRLDLGAFCPADVNQDGFVDGSDADEFNNAFESGDPSADFNGDGFVDGSDADGFNNAFEAGC